LCYCFIMAGQVSFKPELYLSNALHAHHRQTTITHKLIAPKQALTFIVFLASFNWPSEYLSRL
ncbi:hypothetical protein, partial [Shewanella sp.]|uniref:hypothetical protein n=1 Tax=Shewanella sp. TaxID=50422 RepID=UPI0040537E1B